MIPGVGRFFVNGLTVESVLDHLLILNKKVKRYLHLCRNIVLYDYD